MAKDNAGPQAQDAPKPDSTPRDPSDFATFVRLNEGDVDINALPAGAEVWVKLPDTTPGLTQQHAKRGLANAIYAGADSQFKDAIQENGVGVQIAAVSNRVWQPLKVKVEPQKPKLHIG